MTNIIEVSFGGGSIAYVKVDIAYFYNNGIIFKPTDIELPTSYQVHWADSPQATSTLETIGTSEGAPIPDDLWNRSRVIYGWIYLHPTEDSGVTGYEVRIYKNVRAGMPDGTEPTPAEQSTIDQLISALNSAVEQAGQDVESASQSAQSAESAKTAAESARDTAGEYANDAESSAASASTSASQASTSATASAQSASQSAQIKADVEDLVDDAQGYAESASQSASASAQSASASANSASDAQGYANSASASAQSASGYASSAQTSAQTASAKAQDASGYAQTATQKATEASQSASQALTYKTDAESAKTASQTAQGLAESARDTAVQAKNDAESARDEAQSLVDGISGKVEQIDSNTERIESLEDDRYKPYVVDSASGSIASFPDGADDLPLKSLVVDINPVQDLHGQDAPYPAGGGKNILPYAVIESPLTKNGITFVKSQDGSIAVNGTSTRAFAQTFVDFALQPGNYYFNCGNGFSMQSNISLYIRDLDNSRTLAEINTYNVGTDRPFSIDVQTNVRFYMVFGQTDLVISSTLYPMVRLASETDATYAPYENICPISGWTQIGVNQSGVNVWDEEWEVGTIAISTGANASATDKIRSANYIPCVGNTSYCFLLPWAYIFYYDADYQFISYDGNGVTEDGGVYVKTKTTPSNARYMRFRCSGTYGTTYNHNISINYPSTDHSYHPYTGRSITIDLGQTVYGGKLDVISGELVIDRAMVDLATVRWSSYDGTNKRWSTQIQAMKSTTARSDKLWSDRWRTSKQATAGDEGVIFGYLNFAYFYTSDTDNTPIGQLVYELATPIEIQLDSHTLNSLYGVNNIWADSGDTEVEYRADTKAYIAKKIAEALASLT